ncbi:hypothetical protein BTHERMOSOX_1005 [Bathymodiolus thermophilus thioautotrophic gill symbiont]|uniref:Prepilin-type N-terminal cleavage/methylation domain-containing protein n=1 Tax=Bathymodiolus thermophilus thioautotrophic gill symbiont TaxID=2360 RepID=A0A1J5TY22_9GAMM|nr:prepilin-type N-terminal cleavage/methylation domain-containing protein [Bathymodiolus thermophilus thioautotrophic gill symbiont]AYQ56818.1 hypothetical protein MS2017_1114 [Bathymodiolus thermophilus thioautotrophic gill symbiont]OIR25755.1 hypothetical protein BGC33_15385 [Bathymodiolus thermophilus thioautotrophic gill symbiont]CAB5499644.1 hypothetical protein THERMOT_1089 [Bathymodiolus thermophilus thioautotrophic gill symbiont]SHA28657.1 hypothetical protein BTHERMOSOX_1005 [Bathymod
MMKIKNKQLGFTLIELMLVLAVVAMLMQIKIKADAEANVVEQIEVDVKRTMQEIGYIQAAASGYLADEGKWPDFANQCNNAINTLKTTAEAYLNYVTTTSPYNTPYITACDSKTFEVRVKSNKDFAAPYIASQYPGSRLLSDPNGDTSASSIPRPLSLSQFLSLDGFRSMRGDFGMGGNSIIGVHDINLDGQSIKLGIGQFVSMGSVVLGGLDAVVSKPNCSHENAKKGTPKIFLRVQGVTTKPGGILGIRNISWSARFEDKDQSTWRLGTKGLSSISGLAEVFCDYGDWNKLK